MFVPHYAMSGGTLIALAANEIVMSKHAVLGPIDPQLGQSPAASLIKVVEQKPIAEIDDETLIKADVGRKAIAQVKQAATELLTGRHSRRQGGGAGGEALDRNLDARLSDLRRDGEGARLAGQHQHAERRPGADEALSAARARSRAAASSICRCRGRRKP